MRTVLNYVSKCPVRLQFYKRRSGYDEKQVGRKVSNTPGCSSGPLFPPSRKSDPLRNFPRFSGGTKGTGFEEFYLHSCTLKARGSWSLWGRKNEARGRRCSHRAEVKLPKRDQWERKQWLNALLRVKKSAVQSREMPMNGTQARVDHLDKAESKTTSTEERRWKESVWTPTKENCHQAGSTSWRLDSGEHRIDRFPTTVWSPMVEKGSVVILAWWQHVKEKKKGKKKERQVQVWGHYWSSPTENHKYVRLCFYIIINSKQN